MEPICFANENNYCRSLDVKKCPGLKCPFFKTVGEQETHQKRAFERIAALDKVMQTYIAEKYYERKYPWLKGGKMNGR